MKRNELWDRISSASIRDACKGYAALISSDIAELDKFRLQIANETLPTRRKTDGNAFLESAELVRLVEWKLKHGKFRPNLMKLAKSNEAETVRQVTKEAFAKLELSSPSEALDVMVSLKGVGPATASLMLSVAQPQSVPFFSDELFRWVNIDSSDLNSGRPDRLWSRKINYNKKEYGLLQARVKEIASRLDKNAGHSTSAYDLECAAYVLARSALNDDDDDDNDDDGADKSDKRRDDDAVETKVAASNSSSASATLDSPKLDAEPATKTKTALARKRKRGVPEAQPATRQSKRRADFGRKGE